MVEFIKHSPITVNGTKDPVRVVHEPPSTLLPSIANGGALALREITLKRFVPLMNASASTERSERCNAKRKPPRDIELMFAAWLFNRDTVTVVDCNEAAVTPRCRGIADLVGKRAEELAFPMQRTGLSTIESLARYVPETMKDRNSRFRVDGAAVRPHRSD